MSDIDPLANDNQVALHYVVTDVTSLPFAFAKDGSAVDLGNYNAITLRLRRCDGTLIEKALTVDDAPNGLGHFAFISGDLIPGLHKGEVKFQTSAGGKDTFPKDAPILILVRSDL